MGRSKSEWHFEWEFRLSTWALPLNICISSGMYWFRILCFMFGWERGWYWMED